MAKQSEELTAPIPMRIVGPVRITGPVVDGDVEIPLATFETPLFTTTARARPARRASKTA